MKLKACAMVGLSVFLLASQLSAFDGQRKGFVLGIGLGAGSLHYEEAVGTPSSSSFNKTAFATNFKIGYAPSASFEVYLANVVSCYGVEGDSSASGATCVAATKYLNREGKGLFVCGGLGWAFEKSLQGAGSRSGFGAFGGLGYDIARHWNIQADVLYTSQENDYIRTLGFRVTLNVLAF
jgi:hypothetical protein